jgi:hypothetical protein
VPVDGEVFGTTAAGTLGAGATLRGEGLALFDDSGDVVEVGSCSVGVVEEPGTDPESGFSLLETTGTSTSMALPIVPPSIPFSVSALIAIAAVAVPSTPTIVKAVIHEDFIFLEYKTWQTEGPQEIQDLSKISGALRPS